MILRRLICALLLWPCLAVTAGADTIENAEFVATSGPLDDVAFHRLVACGARPSGGCSKPMIFWDPGPSGVVTVGLMPPDPDFPTYKLDWIVHAAVDAIAEINRLGLSLELRFAATPADAAIRIFPTGAGAGQRIARTGFRGLDGEPIQAAVVTVWAAESTIRSAGIALSRDIRRRSLRSVVLEELVQALGLATDIRNPYYRGRSIFDEDSNAVTRLTGQDAEALRRHYPAEDTLLRSASQ